MGKKNILLRQAGSIRSQIVDFGAMPKQEMLKDVEEIRAEKLLAELRRPTKLLGQGRKKE